MHSGHARHGRHEKTSESESAASTEREVGLTPTLDLARRGSDQQISVIVLEVEEDKSVRMRYGSGERRPTESRVAQIA